MQTQNNNIILIGGGGHCKSCIDVIEQQGRFKITGIIDLPEKQHQKILGYPVIGTDDDLPHLATKYNHFLITLGQIKSPDTRMALFEKIKSLGGTFPVIISPLAYVSKHTTVEEGTIVMHKALVNAGATVGKNCIVNTKALIEHDAVIRDHCHIATNTVINGGCTVGEGSFFGSTAMARECIEIGTRCVVGGGGASHAESIFFPDVQGPVKTGVFGASGFSREVTDILNSFTDELVYIDLDPEVTRYFGKPILNETKISQLKQQGFVFVIGAGDNRTRQKIYNRYSDLPFPNIVHPTASMGYRQLERLKMKKGNIITAGARFTNNIEWGDFGIYNLNCTVGHDCIIQDFVNVAPGANVSGNVLIEEGAYIGTNAAVLQGRSIENKIRIGKFSIIGAGAVVTKSINDNATVVGIPAKAQKK